MHKAIIRLTSVTYAIRLQKLLEQRGIRTVIRKMSKGMNVSGCGYGLELDVDDLDTAYRVSSSAGIKIVETAYI